MNSAGLPTSLVEGRYSILRLLGEGGRKRVYLAHDTRLERDVALALIRTEGLDADGLARARHEARAMARLGEHPNIVTVYDVGYDGGQPYIVSELMAGGDLARRLHGAPEHRMRVPTVLRLAKQLCRALEHAHARNVIHRDLKPANVWLTSDGTAKLGDFDLALAQDQSRLTVAGAMVGTVAYMAPEQALGRSVNAESDLYALGALLYEMVAGRPPFVGDNAVAIVSQHLHDAPVAPSWLNAAVPAALNVLILKLLAKTPEERPRSAAAVREMLAAIPPTAAATTVQPAAVGSNAIGRLAAGVFVGRERELVELRAAVEEATSGNGSLVMLLGEPGIGKTRTAQELGTYACLRGLQVLWGRCQESDGAPAYWPWAQMIRTYVHERERQELLAEMGSGAADIAQVMSAVRERLPDLPPAPRLEPEQARFRLFDSVTTFLKNAAAHRPLLVVIDDLHWADLGSLLLLQFLAREIGDARLVVVGTYRDEEAGRRSPLFQTLAELARAGMKRRVHLGRLSEPEVGRYIEMTVGRAPPAALIAAVSRKTEGNPFFLGEVVRLLVAEGRLEGREADALIAIPPAAREVIGRRLDRLSADCNGVLTIAAVVGREFRLDVLERVASVSGDRLLELVGEAAAARVVSEVPQAVDRYSFAHALIRETLSNELTGHRRAGLHRRIGEALEELHAAKPEPHLGELAHHFFEAARDGTEIPKAISYATRAGDHASALLAYEEAASHYHRALALMEVHDPRAGEAERCELLLKLGGARWSAGEFDTAREAFQLAAEAAEQNGDAERLARAALGFGGDHTVEVELEEGTVAGAHVRLLEKALDALDPEDSAVRAKVIGRLAAAVMFSEARERSAAGAREALERSATLARQAREMARRLGDNAALSHVLSTTGVVSWGPDSLDELLPRATEMLRVARETGSPSLMAEAHYLRVVAALMAGDIDTLDRELESHERATKVLRQAHHRWVVAVLRALRAQLVGHFDEAEGLAQQALALGQEARNRTSFHAFGSHMAFLRAFQGRAAEMVEVCEPFAEQYPELSVIHGTLAWAYVELGRVADARRVLDRMAANDFADLPRDILWLSCLQRLGDVAASLSDTRRAAALYELLRPHAHRCATVYFFVFTGSVARSLGVLATTLGRFAEAARHFDDALAVHAAMRARPWLVETQYNYASLLVTRAEPGDRAKALALLTAAIDTAQELGMKALVARALALKLQLHGVNAADTSTSIDEVAAAVEREPADLRPFAASDGTVTILFTDIEGSTGLVDRIGERRAHAFLQTHNLLVREQVAVHGGVEVRARADGFMVVFASARRAALCAIALQRALAGHAAAHPEEPMQARIGLHTGEVIKAVEGSFDRNVLLAARIAAQARGGQIVVSSVLKELAESASDTTGAVQGIRFGPGRTVELKDVEGRRTVFDVIWAGEAAARVGPPRDSFRREGDYWTITYRGASCRLKDARGLHYIGELLRHPGREFHVLDLIQSELPGGRGRGQAGGQTTGGIRDTGPRAEEQGLEILDEAARVDYGRRLKDLNDELAEAEQFSDKGRAERAREEIETITTYLAAAVGLGRRIRVTGSAVERARSTVTHAIKATLRKFRGSLPALADELALRIKTGTYCRYTDDAAQPTDWSW